MKKFLGYSILVVLSIVVVFSSVNASNGRDYFTVLKPSKADLPEGFVFGKIPRFAKKTFKNNPWTMDSASVRKLTSRIYPGGDSNAVLRMHMSIMARQKKPYGDDIVCYVIQYKSQYSKNLEHTKILNHVNHNQDRALMIEKDNIIVYMHSDSIQHFGRLQILAEKIKDRLQTL